ncbi:MAG: flagellar biosynthesis anti-sigma factor FlgM [Aquificae bacterium]|nr:flagellar biosynthesis anti-sigma factor FlgM [Aquificota bacterium]
MAKRKLRKILKKYLSDKEIEKLEKMFLEDKYMPRSEKLKNIKEKIQRGEYNIPPEELAEKMLEFFKKNK